MHRIGLVGGGRIAHFHVAGIRSELAGRAEVVAVCDPQVSTLASFADQHGIEHRFTDVRELARSGQVDVVADLTPPAARVHVIPEIVDAGLHVLVEKPFGNTAREALGYVERAEARGTFMSVNQNFRWFPEIEATKEAIAAPGFGPVRFVEHTNFQDRRLPDGDWRAHEERLELAIFGIHILDRVLWIVDRDPVAVSARMSKSSSLDYTGEQFTSITIFFEDDMVASMTSSWLSAGLPEARLRVEGEGASIEATRWHAARGDASWRIGHRGGDVQSRYFRDTGHFPAAFGKSMGKLLDGVDSGTEPVNSGRNNLRTIGSLDAAYLSASEGGRIVELAEVGIEPHRT